MPQWKQPGKSISFQRVEVCLSFGKLFCSFRFRFIFLLQKYPHTNCTTQIILRNYGSCIGKPVLAEQNAEILGILFRIFWFSSFQVLTQTAVVCTSIISPPQFGRKLVGRLSLSHGLFIHLKIMHNISLTAEWILAKVEGIMHLTTVLQHCQNYRFNYG